MVPKIRIKYKGKEYNLGFSSGSIQEMERRGFAVCEIPKKLRVSKTSWTPSEIWDNLPNIIEPSTQTE